MAKDTAENRVHKMLDSRKKEKLSAWFKNVLSKANPPNDITLKEPLKTTVNHLVDIAFTHDIPERVPTPEYIYELSIAEQARKRLSNKPLRLKQRSKLKKAQDMINAFPVKKAKHWRSA